MGHDELYRRAKFGGDRTTRADCRCENVVFVFCLFFCHATNPEHGAFEGCIVRTSIALPFIAQFRRGFQPFFHKGLLFQMLYIVLIFVARWRHNFREIAVTSSTATTQQCPLTADTEHRRPSRQLPLRASM